MKEIKLTFREFPENISWEYRTLINDSIKRLDDPMKSTVDEIINAADENTIYYDQLWTIVKENASVSEVLEALNEIGIDVYEKFLEDVIKTVKNYRNNNGGNQ